MKAGALRPDAETEGRGVVGLGGDDAYREDRRVVGEGNLEALYQGCENDACLRQGELRPDADAWASPERQISETGGFLLGIKKPRWVEGVGILPPPDVPMQHPRRHADHRTLGNGKIADPIGANCFAHDDESWRVEPQRLIH